MGASDFMAAGIGAATGVCGCGGRRGSLLNAAAQAFNLSFGMRRGLKSQPNRSSDRARLICFRRPSNQPMRAFSGASNWGT
jgi:hypothetical protein